MYRRSGAPRASVRGQRKINQQQPVEKAPRTPVIGVSAVPLSSRFTHLADEPDKKQHKKQQHQVTVVKMQSRGKKTQPVLRAAGGKKNGKAPAPSKKQIQAQQQQKKLQQVAQNNRNKRQQVVTKHRKGLAPQEAKPKSQKKLLKNKNAAPLNGGRGGRIGRGRGAGRGGRGGHGGRGDAKPPSGEDLDMEMDEYWHEAGKGPDPKAAQLDRQMEDYWAAKPAQDTSAAKTEAEPAPDATMES